MVTVLLGDNLPFIVSVPPLRTFVGPLYEAAAPKANWPLADTVTLTAAAEHPVRPTGWGR